MTCLRGRQLSVLIGAALLGCLVFANVAAADPPDRIGRISQAIGPVSFRPATLDEWSEAVPNYPLTTGDDLWTDRAARAEVELGGATARMGAYTSFGVLNLDDHVAQFRVTQGSLALTVYRSPVDDSLEVDTPNGAVSLLRPGFYRIDVNEAGDVSTVTVRDGQADVSASDGRPIALHRDESVVLSGTDFPRVDVTAARGPDEWEDWCRWRDRSAQEAVSARYVSPDTIGYSDLDEYGTWRNVDEYGAVWVPHVRADWVPYRDGRWVWTEPWGWTWVDDSPWGFAPSHYGRWVSMNGVWGWWPGPKVERAIYAPALVAFIGGAGAALGGSIAWFPLGPRDPYVPPYRVSPSYVRAINVGVREVNDPSRIHYMNQGVTGAVTAVPRATFVNASRVTTSARALPANAVREAQVIGTAPQVAPAAVSLVSRSDARAHVPPAAVINRQVIATRPTPPAPVPFAARQPAMTEHPGRPVDPRTLSSIRTETQRSATTPPVRVVTPTSHTAAAGAGAPAPTAPPPSAPTPSAVPRAPAPPEREAQTRVTPVPRQLQPAKPPEPPQHAGALAPPNASDGQLAAQQAAERARLEAQHASEQATFDARRAEEQKRAQDAHAKQQMQQQAEQQKQQLEQREVREHQQLQQRQQAEAAKQHQASKPQAPQGEKPNPPKPKPPHAEKAKPPHDDTAKPR
jgi:hypothetical protein